MISNLKIENFASIKEKVEINFSDKKYSESICKMACFRGECNTGKSNIFKAIKFVRNLILIEDSSILLNHRYTPVNTFIEITFTNESHEYIYGVRVSERLITEEYLILNNEELFNAQPNNQESYLHKLKEDGVKEAVEVYNYFWNKVIFLDKMTLFGGTDLHDNTENVINLIEENLLIKNGVLDIFNKIYSQDIKNFEVVNILKEETVLNKDNEETKITRLVKDVRVSHEDYETYLISGESSGFLKIFIMATHLQDAIVNKRNLIIDDFSGYITLSSMEKFINAIYEKIIDSESTQVIIFALNEPLYHEMINFNSTKIFEISKDERESSKVREF